MSDNQPVIDFSEALSRTLGDVEFLQSMLMEFQNIAPEFLERLENALKKGDTGDLIKDAHQFKGSAANLGIKKVASVALMLETMAKNGNCDDGPQILDDLKKAVQQFNALLAETDFSTLGTD